MSLKTILSSSLDIIKTELFKSKKLSDKQIAAFKNIYGISDIEGDIYINNFNIILTSTADYEKIQYVVKDDDKVVMLNIDEYGLALYILRRFNDRMLDEVLV